MNIHDHVVLARARVNIEQMRKESLRMLALCVGTLVLSFAGVVLLFSIPAWWH